MCRHCRHKDLRDVGAALRERFPVPISPFEKKETLKAISIEIHLLRKERRAVLMASESTYLVDYKRDALSFAAMVLNCNREWNGGWKVGGWMNNGNMFIT